MSRNLKPGRSLLRLLAVLMAFVLVAAACGDDGETSGGDTTTTTGGSEEPGPDGPSDVPEDFDPEGIVRIGTTPTMDQEIHFDPTKTRLNIDRNRMGLVYGALLRENASGGYDPWMAESYDVVDPSTINVTLREGMTFTDGEPYDAEAVQINFMRTRFEPLDEVVTAGWHAGLKFLEEVTVEGPLEVTFHLSEPFAGEFVQTIAGRASAVVSPKQIAEDPDSIDRNPIGAGPYTVLEIDDVVGEKYRKNPDYHNPDEYPIAGFDYIYSPVGPAGVQALQNGDIDYLAITPENIATIEADSRFAVTSNITDFGYMTLNICRKPPFDNADVRRALQLAIDREQINQLVYGGTAVPAYGLWPQDHPRYNPAVEEYNREAPDEARELLENSGVSDLSFDLVIVPSAVWIRLAEVMQSQLNEVGFDVTIQQPANIIADFIQTGAPGVMMVPGSRTNIDKYDRVFRSGGQQSLCDQSEEENVMEPLYPTAGLDPTDPAVDAAYQQVEEYIAENALLIPIVYSPSLTAYNTETLGGEPVYSSSRGIALWQAWGLYPKS